jgi:hypothetical protein
VIVVMRANAFHPGDQMMRNTLVFGLLAGLLAAPGVDGQTAAAGPPTSAAKAVDPAAIQALKDMGAYLQSLKRFHVSTDFTGERVLADGQKLQHSASAEMDVLGRRCCGFAR